MSLSNQKIILPIALLLLGLPLLWVGLLPLFIEFNFDAEAAKQVNKTAWQLSFGENEWWYLLVNISTISFPFLLSFDRKVHFYRKWPYLFPAILIVGIFFLLWDIYFTHLGVWGFNERYYNYPILGLPLGEWLFFVTVPYACVFIHECLLCYFRADPLAKYDKPISIFFIILFLGLGLLNLFSAYTAWTFLLSAGFVAFHLLYISNRYRTRFYIAYLICLIPFVLVNGILTGAFNQEPVVLYNNEHNLMSMFGSRFITIPWDDFIYGFLLVFMNVSIYEYLRAKRQK